jgi:hypothetical protein
MLSVVVCHCIATYPLHDPFVPRHALLALVPGKPSTVTAARLENPSQTAYDTGLALCDAPAVPERRLSWCLYADRVARFFLRTFTLALAPPQIRPEGSTENEETATD